MKNTKSILGFTLIELLVVITIIGILATGAVSVFTSQIQKARDSTRITDIKALQSWVEQAYQDDWEYPVKWAAFSWVTVYVPKLPKDPKSENASANSVFDYMYSVSPDANTIPGQEYEISTHFEQNWSLTWKAEPDGGDDVVRLEIGINVNDTAAKPTTVLLTTWIASSIATYDCVTPTGSAWDCTNVLHPMIIKN